MTNKLGNINYQAIMARANADMQKLQSISSGSNWEEILAILQGEMKNQLPGAGKSIFSIGEDIQGIASGNASQQASAFQNILNDITSLIGNLSTKDSAQANQEVKKNDNEIQKNDQFQQPEYGLLFLTYKIWYAPRSEPTRANQKMT
jgi:hypothetical protein